ncbi:MAG: extracellular solute-binding protein [Clostridia bacterium]|nr:extracellular solute-binding protein [Clostridia bacterium]
MKKLLCLLLVLLLTLPLCTSCHGSLASKNTSLEQPDENEENLSSDTEKKNLYKLPDSFDESKQYELTFWAKNDTNITQTEIYSKAIKDFEALYPNIKIKLRLYNDYSRIYNDVITNIATDTTPNICITYPDHIATYLTGKDTVIPLDGLIDDEKYGLGGTSLKFDGPEKQEIITRFLDECILNGSYYALPYMRSTEACYVNKTFVEKLGFTLPKVMTWDFIWEVSEAATKKDADGNYIVNGQSVLIPFIYKSTDNMMISMLEQLGAGYSNANGDILIFNKETEKILYNVSKHTESGAFSTFKISGYPANSLNAGQCIFAIDSTAGATWMGTEAPLVDISEDRIVKFETVVMPIPQYDTEKPKMISQGPSICIFNKEDPQIVLASWLFCQFMLTNEVQIAYSQTEGYVPVTSKAQNSDEYKDYISRIGEDNQLYYDIKIKASQLLMDNVDNTFVTPVFNGSASLRNVAGQLIENVTKSTRRKETIDDTFMKTMYSDLISLYKLNTFGGKIITDTEDSENIDITKDITEGPLPKVSVALLSTLGIIWIILVFSALYNWKKSRK